MKTLGRNPTGKRQERIEKSPHFKNGEFKNIQPTELNPKNSSFIKNVQKFFFTKIPNRVPPKPLPHVKSSLITIPDSNPTIVWFGHSSYLIKYKGKNILVDPVFSGHSSPFSFMIKAFPGTDAYTVDDLPQIDVLIITHDHYDHLDYETIMQLFPEGKDPKVKHIVTALGVGEHLEFWGVPVNKVTELDWWESTTIPMVDVKMSMTAAPTRHFSGRLQRNKSLWASFILNLESHKIFIGGDSGYDSQFKNIGDKFGPFDLAILECGQYNEGWPLIHMFPERTAQAAKDLGAKVLLPVHWGKFVLSLHAWDEPIKRLSVAAQALGVKYTTPRIGEPFTLGEKLPDHTWWEDVHTGF